MRLSVSQTCDKNPLNEKFEMHTHNNYEILCFLSGDADYYVEGTRYTLRCGDVMVMRKSEFHHLILKSDKPYNRIVVNFDLPFIEHIDPNRKLLALFDERPLGRGNHYSATLFPNNHWEYYLNKMLLSSEEELRIAFLLALLGELTECYRTETFSNSGERGELISSVVHYINENITEELSLDGLCKRFYLSKTHLNRLFKMATGSTVWNYIMIKRLHRAHELIVAGEAPTSVYIRCGFKDYTTFYRAYKKEFNTSPKNDTRQ